jgi:hypothetical protein
VVPARLPDRDVHQPSAVGARVVRAARAPWRAEIINKENLKERHCLEFLKLSNFDNLLHPARVGETIW